MPGTKLSVKRDPVTQPLDPSYRHIALTQGKIALVDAADYEQLNLWNWIAEKTKTAGGFYASRGKRKDEGKGLVRMHRHLFPNSEEVDHENGNGLDNRRFNLRPCTGTQNRQNISRRKENIASSGYMGVYWDKFTHKWCARIKVNYKLEHLGTFTDPIEAAKTRDARAIAAFGQYAHLNFPTSRQ